MTNVSYQSYDAIRCYGEARDTASVVSDGASAIRNTTSAVASGVSGLGAAGAAAIAGLKVLSGPVCTALGICMVRDTHYKVAEARACSHTEGVARHVLYGGMGGGLAAVGGVMTTEAVATLANLSSSAHIVLPAVMGGIILPVAVIGMYTCQLVYSVHSLIIRSQFSSELAKQEENGNGYNWLLEQVTLTESEKQDSSHDQIQKKKLHAFELRASDDAKNLLLVVDKLTKSDITSELKDQLKSYAVEKVKEINYKKKVTNYLLLAIAILGIALGALCLIMTPVGWVSVALAAASAVLAVAWLSVDSSKLHERFCNWRWNAQKINTATEALTTSLSSSKDKEAIREKVREVIGDEKKAADFLARYFP